MINLTPEQFKIVTSIFREVIPNRKIMVFGSRVTGTVKEFADLDLCVMGDEPLSLLESANIKEAFSESPLPFRVDIIDWATTSAEFKLVITANGEMIL